MVRLNTERSTSWGLTLEPGVRWELESDRRSIDSDACSGVWWRRPEWPPATERSADGSWQALVDQWRGLATGLGSVPGPTWVSHPIAIRGAESKAAQLDAAARAGLRVPQTLWTNNLQTARAFLARHGNEAVVKSVAPAYWEAGGTSHFVFARVITTSELPSAATLSAAPVTFQQAIRPKRDIRVTVVGGHSIAAMRATPDRAPSNIDWRLQEEASWRPCEIPLDAAKRCVEVVEKLGLRFAGIDLVLDEQGRFWFIELNPNGEWGWLEAEGLPIASALADELTP